MNGNIDKSNLSEAVEGAEKCFEDTPIDGISQNSHSFFELSRRDFIFAGILVFLSILGVFAGAFGGFNLGFTLSFIPMLIALSVYLLGSGGKIRVFPAFCGVSAATLSVVYSLGAAASVKFWIFVLIFICSAIWLDSLTDVRAESGDLGLIYNFIYTAVVIPTNNCVKAVSSIFVGKMKSSGNLFKIVIGAILALPALLVIVPLLVSSDAAFEALIMGIAGNLGMVLLKILLGLMLACLVLGYGFAQRKDNTAIPEQNKAAGIDPVYVISFLAMISLCYVVYLFSQLAYFFTAFSGILPEDFTFTPAQYARRGFFEMCIIASLNLVFVLGSLLLTAEKNGKVNIGLKIMGTFISLFTLLIIGTALSKMVLYIDTFGMTVLRITTSAFMVFLAVVFLAVIARCYTKRAAVIKTAIITAAAVVGILGFVNVESAVAHYNYTAWKTDKLKTIDISTIYELGDEGVPYLVKLAGVKDKEISAQAKNYLLDTYIDYYEYDYKYNDYSGETHYTFKDKKYSGFEKWNYNRAVAYELLDAVLEKNPDFGDYQRDYT